MKLGSTKQLVSTDCIYLGSSCCLMTFTTFYFNEGKGICIMFSCGAENHQVKTVFCHHSKIYPTFDPSDQTNLTGKLDQYMFNTPETLIVSLIMNDINNKRPIH